ncbi:hypothetical protein Tco_0587626 [Tanacetum coccineum]
MNTTQAQQKALDDALVAPADRLEFGKYNMRLKTDIKSKEATFKVVLDALALTSFYQAFLITTEVPAIYIQEFWATASIHKDLGHSGDITYLTDVSVDYLHQPWRAFATVINKCLSGKETRIDKIRLSHAQILWGMFYKKNIDYVYLLWEYFMFHIENKDAKKTYKMSYSRFTKIIIDYFMSKDQHEDTQVYGSILPKELTNQVMLESKAYKTYYAFASAEKTLKPKYVRKKADPDTSPKQKPVQANKGTRLKTTTKVALTEAEQIKLATKRSKTQFHSSYASGSSDGVDTQSKVPNEQQQKTSGTDEGTGTKPGVPDVPKYDSKSEKEPWGDSNEEDDDDEDDFEDDVDDNDDDDGDNDDGDDNDSNDDDEAASERIELDREEIPNLNQSNNDDKEKMDKEEDDEVTKELYKDVNVNLGTEDKTDGTLESSFVSSNFTSKLLNLDNTPPCLDETSSQTSSLFTILKEATPTPTPLASEATTSTSALPDFAYVFKFNERVINLEKYLSEMKQVDQYAKALASIPAIVDRYIDNKLREVINKAILAHNLDCRQEAQDEKNEYIGLVDISMRNIIKEEITTQLPQILPQSVSNFATPVIKKNVAKFLEVVVLTRSSSQPQSTYEAAATLTEFELIKILIDKMEKNKLFDKADHKRELYKMIKTKIKNPLLDQTEGQKEESRAKMLSPPKIQEEPSHTVEDSGMKQDQEFVTGDNDEQPADKEVTNADWFKKPERPPTLDPDYNKRQQVNFRPPQTWISQATQLEYHLEECSKATTEKLDWHNPKGKPYPFDLKKPLPLISYHRGRQVIPQDYFINNDLEYLKGGDLSKRYSTSVTKTKAATYEIKWIEDLVQNLLTIENKYDYGHLEEIKVRRDDQHLYTLKEGDFPRLCLHDIEDMLLLFVQQKLTNLTIDKLYDLNVALNLRNRTAYTSYSDPQGVIYMDNFERKRLMRADELHKFSDGTLNDVRTTLYDISKGLRMEYLPKRK